MSVSNFLREVAGAVIQDQIQATVRQNLGNVEKAREILLALPFARHRAVSRAGAQALSQVIRNIPGIDRTLARVLAEATGHIVAGVGSGIADLADTEAAHQQAWTDLVNNAVERVGLSALDNQSPTGDPGDVIGIYYRTGPQGFHKPRRDADGNLVSVQMPDGEHYVIPACGGAYDWLFGWFERNQSVTRTRPGRGRNQPDITETVPAKSLEQSVMTLAEFLELAKEPHCPYCKFIDVINQQQVNRVQAARHAYDGFSDRGKWLIDRLVASVAHDPLALKILADLMTQEEMKTWSGEALTRLAETIWARNPTPGDQPLSETDLRLTLATIRTVGDSTLELTTQLLQALDDGWKRLRSAIAARPRLARLTGSIWFLGASAIGIPGVIAGALVVGWILFTVMAMVGWFFWYPDPPDPNSSAFFWRLIPVSLCMIGGWCAFLCSNIGGVGSPLLRLIRRFAPTSTAAESWEKLMLQITGYYLGYCVMVIPFFHLAIGSDLLSLVARICIAMAPWASVSRDALLDKAAKEPQDLIDVFHADGTVTKVLVQGRKARFSISAAMGANSFKRLVYLVAIFILIGKAWGMHVKPGYLYWTCKTPIELETAKVYPMDYDEAFARDTAMAETITDASRRAKALAQAKADAEARIQTVVVFHTPDGEMVLAQEAFGAKRLEKIIQDPAAAWLPANIDIDVAGHFTRCAPYELEEVRKDPSKRWKAQCYLGSSVTLLPERLFNQPASSWGEFWLDLGAKPYSGVEDPGLRYRVTQMRSSNADQIARTLKRASEQHRLAKQEEAKRAAEKAKASKPKPVSVVTTPTPCTNCGPPKAPANKVVYSVRDYEPLRRTQGVTQKQLPISAKKKAKALAILCRTVTSRQERARFGCPVTKIHAAGVVDR